MSDKFVTVALFSVSHEAQLACGRLDAEGIPAFLLGGHTADAIGIQGVAGKIELRVSEADAARAEAILAECMGEDEPDSGPVAEEPRIWVCPLCGDAVSESVPVCPACQTERAAGVVAVPRHQPASRDLQKEKTSKSRRITDDVPAQAPADDDELELPPLETMYGDDMVSRAFVAALFGFACGFLTLYSLYQLGRLAVFPGKVSPEMMPKLYWAIGIDLFVCFVYLGFWASRFAR